jgi:hypothetical protein
MKGALHLVAHYLPLSQVSAQMGTSRVQGVHTPGKVTI